MAMSELGGVFVGGTGRSGTTVLTHLLSAGPHLERTVPTEVRFLTDSGGLLDLIAAGPRWTRAMGAAGAAESRADRAFLVGVLPERVRRRLHLVTAAEFSARMRGEWFNRDAGDGRVRGLHRGMSRRDLEAALAAFELGYPQDAVPAARQLAIDVLSLLSKAVRRGESPAPEPGPAEPRPHVWVESTPDNARRAPEILALLPSSRVIHVVRDGRDTAASVVGRSWGPRDPLRALRWWESRLVDAYRGLAQAPPHAVLTIRLEDLVERDRAGTFERLRAFLRLDGAREWEYLTSRMPAERAHPGRWRDEVPQHLHAQFEHRYQSALVRIRARFGQVPPTEDLD